MDDDNRITMSVPVFDLEELHGKTVRILSVTDGEGRGPGLVLNLVVAVDSQDRVYVLDVARTPGRKPEGEEE